MRNFISQFPSRTCLAFLLAFGCLTQTCRVSVCHANERTSGILGAGQPWQTPYYINDSGVTGPAVLLPSASMAMSRLDTAWPTKFVIGRLLAGRWSDVSKGRIHSYLNLERLLEGGVSVASFNYRYVTQAPDSDDDRPMQHRSTDLQPRI